MQHDSSDTTLPWRFEVYLGGGEDDASDQLRLCEDLNLLNDLHTPIQQNQFVEESRLWTSERRWRIINTEYRFERDKAAKQRPRGSNCSHDEHHVVSHLSEGRGLYTVCHWPPASSWQSRDCIAALKTQRSDRLRPASRCRWSGKSSSPELTQSLTLCPVHTVRRTWRESHWETSGL